jgi:hypothetical protein
MRTRATRIRTQGTSRSRVNVSARDEGRAAAVGTWAAVIIGIFTVALSGAATYYDAKVAADTLEQSRQDTAKEDRAQAARVSYWVDNDTRERNVVHLVNGSPNPITGITIDVHVFTATPAPAHDGVKGPWADALVTLASLGPCTQYQFPLTALVEPRAGAWMEVRRISFYDGDGKHWYRDNDTLARDTSSGIDLTDHRFDQMGRIEAGQGAQWKRFEPCEPD